MFFAAQRNSWYEGAQPLRTDNVCRNLAMMAAMEGFDACSNRSCQCAGCATVAWWVDELPSRRRICCAVETSGDLPDLARV
jgi:hypothetical protein